MSDGVREEEMCGEIAQGAGGGSIMREIERGEDSGRMSEKKAIYIRPKTVLCNRSDLTSASPNTPQRRTHPF